METKMEFKNEDGKTIIKNIPNNLVSQYENMGWKVVKKENKEEKANIEFRK